MPVAADESLLIEGEGYASVGAKVAVAEAILADPQVTPARVQRRAGWTCVEGLVVVKALSFLYPVALGAIVASILVFHAKGIIDTPIRVVATLAVYAISFAGYVTLTLNKGLSGAARQVFLQNTPVYLLLLLLALHPPARATTAAVAFYAAFVILTVVYVVMATRPQKQRN